MNQTMDHAASSNVPVWASWPYSIKRYGTSLTTCESEPVQTPGCIQAHGVLVTARLPELTVLQISENSARYFDEAPEQLLGQPLQHLIGADHMAGLRAMLAGDAMERNVRFAFTLAARGVLPALDVCVHTVDGMLVLECEPTDRTASLAAVNDTATFAQVRTAINRLQQVTGLVAFCQQLTVEVQALTRLDRVMVYRFHADHHGEVVAETKRDGMPPWLGLHYPEGDIPKPARDMYKRMWIRPLPDAAGPLIEMVPLANPDTGKPLDMTHCSLRGASVMYTEYLANMGVSASLTLSILLEGELWGMIACHHNTPTCFPHAVRAACELLAQVASQQLKSSERIEQLACQAKVEHMHQQLVAKATRESDLLALSDLQPSLLDAMDAEGAALYHLDCWWCAGKTPNEQQLDALAGWLLERPEFSSLTRPVFATDALSTLYPPGVEFVDCASGVIAVCVSRVRRDMIMWFRPETIQTVNWAGNPHDQPMVPGPHGPRLTPRRSFELFVESVRARSLPWSRMEVDSALRLRLLVMDLATSAGERMQDLNTDLASSNEELDAFAYVASHDLKEPLRGIHRYAYQILESPEQIGPENRARLKSVMRLTLRMDSLLDSLMHYSRVGRTNLEFEEFDLNEVVAEAAEMVGVRESDDHCSINFARPLPTVPCDRVRVREIFSNLISNALKYTRQRHPRIDIGHVAPEEEGPRAKAPAEAAGQTIYFVRDDGIGIDERHFEHIFRMFKRLNDRDEFGGGVGAGLTVVKKVVQRHGGVVWLESFPNRGSTFYFTLPCSLEPGRSPRRHP
ncbi:MAG: multi-sensor signal transduction histidine kinase [Polaromonas sp.]|nr:multi-sensor signal transduction histidine kinase [Polaromonas sp.]